MTRRRHADTLAQEWNETLHGLMPPDASITDVRHAKAAFYRGARWVHDEIRQALADNDPTRIDGILRAVALDIRAYQETLGRG